jgi:serine/threonine protein kinase
MTSLLKPHPPAPRAPNGPATGRSKVGPHATGATMQPLGGFELLMRELELNRGRGAAVATTSGASGSAANNGGRSGSQTPRSRSNSRAAPSTARVPSASRGRQPLSDQTNGANSARKPSSDQRALAMLAKIAAAPPQPYVENPTGMTTPRGAAASSSIASSPSVAPSTPRNAATANPSGSSSTSQGLSWQESAAKYASFLTAFETREIQQYERTFYCGQQCTRKVQATELAGTNNHGFDDAQSDYRFVQNDHIAYRYQLVAPLGRGSFGQVWKAVDHKGHPQEVAVKVIKNKKKFHEQALIEIKVLKHLNKKDPEEAFNVVRMLNHFQFRDHVVIVFELEAQSLYDLHKAHRFAPMTEAAVRNFGRQMLQTLVLTHKEHVVHCDLKPENVLLVKGSKTRLRVIDFGSACFDSERLYTYIQSRFYRAPEVLLGIPYTPAIDVWSLGCMLAEFSNGYPLFPGESEQQQMLLVMETMGLPPRSMLDRAPRKRVFFDATGAPKLVPNSRGRTPRPNTKRLVDFVQCTNPDFLDLLEGLLAYEPERRLTPSEALRHRFFAAADALPVSLPSEGVNLQLPRLQPSRRR